MPQQEVCFLISHQGAILYGDASNSPVGLPDSRKRWEQIWRFRTELAEIAHSHPVGPAAFSAEDESTMEALVSGLGRAPRFSVVAPNSMIVREQNRDTLVKEPPWWVALLRLASGMPDARVVEHGLGAEQAARGSGAEQTVSEPPQRNGES